MHEEPKNPRALVPRTTPTLNSLYELVPTLLEPHVVENRVYKNVDLSLDGYTFQNCAFIGCILRANKGNFHVIACHFSSCTVLFTGNALKIVRLSSLLLESWQNVDESLRPHIERDGGVTL